MAVNRIGLMRFWTFPSGGGPAERSPRSGTDRPGGNEKSLSHTQLRRRRVEPDAALVHRVGAAARRLSCARAWVPVEVYFGGAWVRM